jgi:hypothetical protein
VGPILVDINLIKFKKLVTTFALLPHPGQPLQSRSKTPVFAVRWTTKANKLLGELAPLNAILTQEEVTTQERYN